MKRSSFALLALSILITACPGAKPPATPNATHDGRPDTALLSRLSKSGLGFRLSNADEGADREPARKVTASTPLDAKEAKALAARLPPLKGDADDVKAFSLRDKSIPAPRSGKTEKEAFPPDAPAPPVAATSSGPLTIERHAPEGAVPIAPHLSVTFSQPMVALTSIDEIAKEQSPVKLSPQPPGKWRWLGTRTLMFQPDARFPMATDYTVDIAAGTRSVAGGALAKAEHWTFTTPPVTLTRSWPQGTSERRDVLMFAEFDQAIDPAAMLKAMTVTGSAGASLKLASADDVEADDSVRRLAQGAQKGRWLAFRPASELPVDTAFKVHVTAGAPSAEGPRTTTKEQTFGFKTFGPLRVHQASCAHDTDRCSPLQPLSIQMTNQLDRKRFDPKQVTITPPIDGAKIEVSGNSIEIQGVTKGRTRYEVRLAAGLTDAHGQTLGSEAKVTMIIGSMDPTLFRVEPMVVLDPAGPKALTVYSMNERVLHVRVYSVVPEAWGDFTRFMGEWERPRRIAAPGKLVVDTMVKPKAAADELAATQIDLTSALAGGLGHVMVSVERVLAQSPKDSSPAQILTWVQSTQLGLSAVIEADAVTGWVTKLADGAPVRDADVQILGAGAAKTDKDGLARIALGDRPGKLILARQGKDVTFAPEGYWAGGAYAKIARPDDVRWLVFDDRGMYKPGEEVHVKGFVRRASLARDGDIDRVPGASGATLAYKIRDPRGAELVKGNATIDDQGGFDLAFKLPANANLGQAGVALSFPNAGNNAQYTHYVRIEEFRRPEFEVSARVDPGAHFVGENAVATLSASYYAGGGLADAPVEWTVHRSEATFTPPNRSDFHFGPEPQFMWGWRDGGAPSKDKTETWKSHTNAQGVHRLQMDFEALEPAYPMTINLTGEVVDVNEQEWAGRASLLVHPASEYVGIKLAKGFVRAGEALDVDVLVTDIDGKVVGDREVVVKAGRVVSSWDEDDDATTLPTHNEEDVQTCRVTSHSASPDAKGETVRCTLPTTRAGSWRVWAVVTDARGRRNQSTSRAWVLGTDMPKDRSLKEDRATLVLDKPEHVPGDVAEVLVIAPFSPAEGLLTVRRQGVVHIERFTMATTTQALHVKLEDAHVPNVEIAVSLVGADARTDAQGNVDARLPKRPAFAQGTASVKVLPVTRTLAVKATAKAPALAPGGTTQIDVDVRDAQGQAVRDAEVAVVVADEAVLALSAYKTPDPVAVFYSPRGTDVRDLGMREHVQLADPSTMSMTPSQGPGGGAMHSRGAFGGMAVPTAAPAPSAMRLQEVSVDRDADGILDSADREPPIALRTDFSALALFSPRVRTDASGHATVPVKMPDNLTRYRVMAVAAAGDRQFGSNESSITARLPLMVRPSAPRFLSFGDRFELPVVVQNQTDAPLDVSILVRASNAALDAPAAKRVTIAANDRAEVRFGAAAVSAGTARFQIGVAAGTFADASQIALPVYTPATTEAFATYGTIDEGAIAQQVKMPPGVFPQFGGLEISTSSTQLQALTDAVLYLVKYPYECNEQIASRVIAIAALRDVLTAFQSKDLPSPEVLAASVKEDLDKLKRHQNASGGWGFWQEEPWPYLSVHVAHALVRAQEKGYTPDATMLSTTRGYLRMIEAHMPSWYTPEWRRVIVAYALYVRKRMNDADPARARRLIVEAGGIDKLPIEAVGWIWPTISEDKASQAENEAIRRLVANRSVETAGNAHFVSGYRDGDWVLLSSDRRADGVLLEAMIGDQPQSTLIPKVVKGLLDHRKAGHWMNTQENAFVLLALDRYFKTYEKTTPDFIARVWLGDRFAGQHAFKGRTTERSEIDIPMQWLATELKAPQNLVVGKDGPGRLYYRLGMQYAPANLKLPPTDQGFAVSRIYEGADKAEDVRRDTDGTWRVKIGARVRVRVSMVATSRRYHVALVDPLPAGLEPMNSALAVTGEIPKDPSDAKQGGNPYWYWERTWYEHQNMRDERVEAFASLLWDGVWDYTYVARATTPGTFVVGPPKAEEMYAPETFGRGAGDRMIVE